MPFSFTLPVKLKEMTDGYFGADARRDAEAGGVMINKCRAGKTKK